MKYVIYTAVTDKGNIINMTCNPNIDYTYLKTEYGVKELQVLSPYLDISYINYMMMYMESSGSPFQKFLQRPGRKGNNHSIELIKKSYKEMGIIGIKRSWIMNNSCDLPQEDDLKKIYSLLKGRIIDYYGIQEIIDSGQIFLETSIDDILQMLYLKGKIKVFPALQFQKALKRCACTRCSEELLNVYEEDVCPACGNSLDLSLPLYAASYNESHSGKFNVKYKENKYLSFAQKNASEEVCKFVKSNERECLLLAIQDTLDTSILMKAVRETLEDGERVLISCRMDKIEKIVNKITGHMPDTNVCIYNDLMVSCDEKIVLCEYNHIDKFYDAFDLVIMHDDISVSIFDRLRNSIKRAVKDTGKIVYISSSPDYSLYKRALSGEIRLVTVPIRNHGRPHPEPRILVYKYLSWKDYHIPQEVLDFIIWSLNEKIKIVILLPTQSELDTFREKITENLEMELKNFYMIDLLTMLTVSDLNNIKISESFNTIVFFAENDRYNEKTLVEAAGMSGRIKTRIPNEVIFVGSRESDEMYNAKMLLRFLNKCAWEMGYLKFQ